MACSICDDPYRLAFVDEKRALGITAHGIERLSREPDAQDRGVRLMKDRTIMKHWRHEGTSAPKRVYTKKPKVDPRRPVVTKHVEVSPPPLFDEVGPPNERLLPALTNVPLPPGDESPKDEKARDIAMLVAVKAAEGIEDGSLRVTTAHGLQAQSMLDRREERRKDRELAIAMGRLLSGSMRTPAHLIVVEGTATEVTEESQDDMLVERALQG